jgi:carboxyl-terminal processing protease
MDELPFDTKRYWVEYVLPRRKMYKGKVYVIVGHWTGSMGEGMAIGFDVMKNVTVIGTRMAGLLGAIDGFELDETKIHFQIPTERLFHINGTPREKYLPRIITRNTDETFERLKALIAAGSVNH